MGQDPWPGSSQARSLRWDVIDFLRDMGILAISHINFLE